MPSNDTSARAMPMVRRAEIVFGCFILLTGCSARNARQGSSPPIPVQGSTLRSTSAQPLEDRTLAEYKRYYERFRHIEDIKSDLPIQQEAKLARDYASAREEFHLWLWFVTDTIQQQSQLEPAFREGLPDNEYCKRTARASAALGEFNRDLSDLRIPRSAEPPFTSEQRLYELGRALVVNFSNLDLDNAQTAGEELLTKYSWDR